MNKREFVIGSAAAAVAALAETAGADVGTSGIPDDAAARAAPLSPFRRLPDLAAAPDLAAWRPYAGSVFATHELHMSRRLVLDSIRDVARDRHAEQFTLLFRSTDGRSLAGGMYALTHPNGQRVMAYLTPSATAAEMAVAHFNRLI